MELRSSIRLSASLATLFDARRFVEQVLHHEDAHLAGAAKLVASELVANAVLHGPDAPIDLAVSREPGRGVRVEVADHGAPFAAVPRNPRGLWLITTLASRWGVEPRDALPGKIVWAEIDDASGLD